MPGPFARLTRAELLAAEGATIPDVIAPGLQVLFCGINPGLFSGATGYHFAKAGNRFWPALHAAGFTDRLLRPWESAELLERGYGVTNVVPRTTATAAELLPAEFVAGGRALRRKIGRFRPRAVAFLGIGAYRLAFALQHAALGRQPDRVGDTDVWVLPNPSGLNAHYQLPELARLFAEVRHSVE